MSARRWVVLGNAENRRVTGFVAALHAAGQRVDVCPWLDFLRDPRALPSPDHAIFRIDALGESAAVEQALLRLGRARAIAEGAWVADDAAIDALPGRFGAILAPRQAHLGFGVALDWLDAALQDRPGWLQLNPTATIRACFDKRVCLPLLERHGVPIPPAFEPGDGDLPTPGDGLVIKLSSGSSASCLGTWRAGPLGPELFTSMERAPTGLYNSLRPRVYRGRAAAELIALLLREGARVEHFIPKAEMDGQNFDLRVLVVAGEPAFTVVRRSPHPITNLHLGGTRGDVERLADIVPAAVLDRIPAAMRACARALPALHLGVDVLVERDPAPGSPGLRVLEVNAFGDLLPNLTRVHQGRALSVYDWEIATVLGWDGGSLGPPLA